MSDEFTDPDLSLWQTMAAGSVAGMSEHLVMFPVDTIKTRMMSENVGTRYRSMFRTGQAIMAAEGARGFYSGFLPAFLAAVPSHAAMFTAYEFTKTSLTPHTSNEVAVFLGAAAATCMHDTVSVPFDVVKQRMQEKYSSASTMQCIRAIYAREGLSAFFKSLPATYLMNLPNQAVHWLTYEAAKRAWHKDIDDFSPHDYFLCGVCLFPLHFRVSFFTPSSFHPLIHPLHYSQSQALHQPWCRVHLT